MDTYGCMTGGQSFTAPLNSALVDPLDTSHIQMKGCHVSGDDSQGGSLLCLYAPSATGVEDSGSTSSGSWGGGLDMVVVGVHQCILTGGWAINADEWDRAPHKSPYKPSTSDPTTAKSTFWRPTVSRCWTSSHRRLVWCNNCTSGGPEKKKGERNLSQKSDLAIKQLKNSPKSSGNKKTKRSTQFSSPWASSSARAGTPLPLSRSVPSQAISYCSWVEASSSSSSDDSSSHETIPDVQKGSG